jgi:hypothetical protein
LYLENSLVNHVKTLFEGFMANIKVTIAYDGTNYHGFQEQRGTGFLTVQGVFEEACPGWLKGKSGLLERVGRMRGCTPAARWLISNPAICEFPRRGSHTP